MELEVTPNRPDCLGVYGVARELHAATGAPLAPAPWSEDPGSAGPLEAGGGRGAADDGSGWGSTPRRGGGAVPGSLPPLHRAGISRA